MVADAIAWVGPRGANPASNIADPASAQSVQHAVDTSDQPWRLEPLQAARADTAGFGYSADDPMRLMHEEAGPARLRAQHAGNTYEIRLIQPARLGPSGIWVVRSIQLTGPVAAP